MRPRGSGNPERVTVEVILMFVQREATSRMRTRWFCLTISLWLRNVGAAAILKGERDSRFASSSLPVKKPDEL